MSVEPDYDVPELLKENDKNKIKVIVTKLLTSSMAHTNYASLSSPMIIGIASGIFLLIKFQYH